MKIEQIFAAISALAPIDSVNSAGQISFLPSASEAQRTAAANAMAQILAGIAQPTARQVWEEAAIRRAARLLAPNRTAVESLLLIRPSAEHSALRAFRAEIIRISTLPQHAKGQTLVSLAASTNEDTAFALLNAAYATAVTSFYAAIAAIDPSPAYRAAVKLDFDLVIDQMKAAL